MKKLDCKPGEANKSLAVLRKMFNLAEICGYCPDGANLCRHIPLYTGGKTTRLITDDEMAKLFKHLEQIEAEGLVP